MSVRPADSDHYFNVLIVLMSLEPSREGLFEIKAGSFQANDLDIKRGL